MNRQQIDAWIREIESTKEIEVIRTSKPGRFVSAVVQFRDEYGQPRRSTWKRIERIDPELHGMCL